MEVGNVNYLQSSIFSPNMLLPDPLIGAISVRIHESLSLTITTMQQHFHLITLYTTMERPTTAYGYTPVIQAPRVPIKNPQANITAGSVPFVGTTSWQWSNPIKPNKPSAKWDASAAGVLLSVDANSDPHLFATLAATATTFGPDYINGNIEFVRVQALLQDNTTFTGMTSSVTNNVFTVGTTDVTGNKIAEGPMIGLQRSNRWSSLQCELNFADSLNETNPLSAQFGFRKYCSAIDFYVKQQFAAGQSPDDIMYRFLLLMLNTLRPALNAQLPAYARKDLLRNGWINRDATSLFRY